MVQNAIERLHFLLNLIPDLLQGISEENMSGKPQPNKWSKKEIVGHLIDSATNNHQRFIRAQFESKPEISYDQNKWNEFSFYQEIERTQIIHFWTIYNRQLLEIIKRIPEERLMNQVKVGEKLLTLEYLIVDYVEHLEHHLKQVITY